MSNRARLAAGLAMLALLTAAALPGPGVSRVRAEGAANGSKAIGRTETPLQTHGALLTDTHAIQLVNEVQMARVKRALRGTEYAGLPVLSAAAPCDLTVNILAGEIGAADMASLYSENHTLKALMITGRDLKGWLEHSARQFNQVTPGSGSEPMLNQDWPACYFDQIDGVTYAIDITRPAGERIVNLRYQGRTVTDGMQFAIATHSDRAGGDGGFPGTGAGAVVVYDQAEPIRQLIIEYVEQQGVIAPRADHNWRLVPNFLEHWAGWVAYDLMAKGIALPDPQGRMNLDGPITNLQYVALIERTGLRIPVATAVTEEGPISRATGIQLLAYALVGEEKATADPRVLSRFPDAARLPATKEPALAWAVANGLAGGDDKGRLRPGDRLTRAEAFQLVWNGLHR